MTGQAEIDRIVRAFDAAHLRFAEADSFDVQGDEASNMLHHLYRLSVAVHGDPGWQDLAHLPAGDPLRIVPALNLLRHKDVHMFLQMAKASSVYPDTYTRLYGVLTWVDLDKLPDEKDPSTVDGRVIKFHAEELNGKAVISSCRDAKDAMLAFHAAGSSKAGRERETV